MVFVFLVYTGSHCELCEKGFYRVGGTTALLTNSCVACPCQGAQVLSPECRTVNDTVICTDCAPGYMGIHCDRLDI